MLRRLPAIVTLLPVTALLLGYYWWWDGRADAFRASLERAAPGLAFEVRGFPYRLEAAGQGAERSLTAGAGQGRLRVTRWTLEQQPWRDSLSVIGMEAPVLSLGAPGLPALRLSAATGRASVNRAETRISSEFTDAEVALTGVLPAFHAGHFELHGRRPVGSGAGSAPSAERLQLYARGSEVRFGSGAPIAFELGTTLRGPRPLTTPADWQQGGTLQTQIFHITGAAGVPLADISATVTPIGTGLRYDGIITTTCPRQFAALFGVAAPPGPEYRARRPVTLRFAGPSGSVRLVDGLPAALPVRNREAPCPVLAG